MGKAAAIAVSRMAEDSARVGRLRDLLETLLLESCPESRVNGRGQPRLPNTSNISFRYLEGDSILVLLDQQGICASTGSACTAGSSDPSHVLRAMKVPADWLQGAIRFSLGRFNTEKEVRYVNQRVPAIVQRLQGLSALGKLGSQQEPQTGRRATTAAGGVRE
jgi:cysteine desulfurase